MLSKETQRFMYAGMSWWMRDAAHLSHMGKASESEHCSDYDSRTIKQSIVHTRQDLVLMVSLLDSVNKQLRWTRWLLGTVVALLAWKILFAA